MDDINQLNEELLKNVSGGTSADFSIVYERFLRCI